MQRLGKPGQQHRVDKVRFRVLAQGAAEMPDLPWIQNADGDPGVMQGQHRGLFQAAGRFHDHQRWLHFREPDQQGAQSILGLIDGEDLPARQDCYIQTGF
ncbi:hypothetical protein Q0M94_20540 (plasmid) [Deinococcus radiomollis]